MLFKTKQKGTLTLKAIDRLKKSIEKNPCNEGLWVVFDKKGKVVSTNIGGTKRIKYPK